MRRSIVQARMHCYQKGCGHPGLHKKILPYGTLTIIVNLCKTHLEEFMTQQTSQPLRKEGK